MKCFWFGVFFLAFCVFCGVFGDYSDPLVPSKESRNHRTMRMNMRVGKRLRDSDFNEEVSRRRFFPQVRVGKRVLLNDPNTQNLEYTEPQIDTYSENNDILNNEISEVDRWAFLRAMFLSPNRRLRLVFRTGKRSIEDFDAGIKREEKTFTDEHMSAPKRKLRMIMRTGKRDTNTHTTHLNTESNFMSDSKDPDFKRSSPQFLLNPRVGKYDKTWKINTLESIHKRSDPKATDLWFGPRIGRSNNEFEVNQSDDIPWAYIVLNGNRLPSLPILKSNEVEEQWREESAE